MGMRPLSGPVREALLQGVVLLALLAAAFPGFFLQGEVLSPADILFQNKPWAPYAPPGWERPQNPLMSDIVSAFVPFYTVTRIALEQGSWPLWNPYELGGVPLLANYQSAVLYPPRLLHAFLDLHWASSIYIVLKLWLCGMTAYICGRGVGLGVGASRFLSVAWMFAGYNLIWCYWPLPDVSAWLPVVFLGTERALQGRYRAGFAATALGGTLILLAGHPESAFTMSLGVGTYFLLRLLLEGRRGRALWMPLAVSGGAWLLALLICAAQVLPFLEYLRNSSTFFERADEEKVIALPPTAVATFFVPRFFGTDADGNYWGAFRASTYAYMMVYPGLAVIVMAVLLLTPGPVRSRYRTHLWALLIPTGLFGLLAFNEPTLRPVNSLPPFRSMVLYYHAAFGFFALPLVAALGVEHWFSQPRRLRSLWPVALPAAMGTAICLVMTRFFWDQLQAMGETDYVLTQMGLSAGLAVLTLAPLAAYAFGLGRRAACALLTLVLVADMLVVTRGLNPSMERRYVFPETALTRYLKALEPPSRVGAAEANLPAGIVVGYGIEEMYGYDGLYPHRIIYWLRTLGRSVWKAMEPTRSIAHYLHWPHYEPMFSVKMHPNRYEKIAEVDGVQIFRNHGALPRAYLVPRARVVADRRDMFRIMSKEDFDPSREALLEAPLSCPLPEAAPESPGTARITEYRTTHVEVEVDTPQDAVLVQTDAYYPGWTVAIDGEATEIFPVYYVWRGVRVPAGRHTVEFNYFPVSLKAGLAVSTLTCSASVIFCGLYLVRTRRRRPSRRYAPEISGGT